MPVDISSEQFYGYELLKLTSDVLNEQGEENLRTIFQAA